jgi:REP element-mobilizing transposase RayT
MPQRKEPFIPGLYYHVYNRGVNSSIVFQNKGNYFFFLRRMREILNPNIALICAYVLMPTHYHMLIQVLSTDFPSAMGRLIISYTKAFNHAWGRSGPLFEGRFKSKWVDSDEYILGLARYIHLNPVSANLVENPVEWPYSNYSELIRERNEMKHQDILIHGFFESVDPGIGYQHFVEDGPKGQGQLISHLLFD